MHFFAIEPEKKRNRKAVAARMDAIKMLYIYEQRDYPFFSTAGLQSISVSLQNLP